MGGGTGSGVGGGIGGGGDDAGRAMAHTDLLADDFGLVPSAVSAPSLDPCRNGSAAIGDIMMMGGVVGGQDRMGGEVGVSAAAAASVVGLPAVDDDMHVGQALMKQIEMQTQLHEQLMAQRKLQQAIEAHGKYLAGIMEQQRMRRGEPPLPQMPPPPIL